MKRLGVFGGAFDPPHVAHVALAEQALQQLQLDELRVVPTGQAWHKTRPLTAAVHRLAMTRLAFGHLPQVVVDERELRRSGPSYTVDTLRELAAEWPDTVLYLLIGEDQAQALPSWRHSDQLTRLAIICVAVRPDLEGAAGHFDPPTGLEDRFCRLDLPAMAVSATDIRQRVGAREGIAPLVGAPVARYIEQHRLYPTA